MKEIAKAYNPPEVEDKWFKFWIDKDIFHSEVDETKKPYTIVIPPPNITGILTLGHILNNTIQDVYIRMKRMQGYNACWVPGTDHASIATETKVTKFLKEKGLKKQDVGREEFLKHCKEWRAKYGGIIIQQLKKLGVSCDWDRERFTMDDDYYDAVINTFIALYNEGKIYRGYRMVNWDPASRSAISNEEVNFRESAGKLWYIKYQVKDSNDFIVVATTRPETMLGDTGLAVNPNDERYTKYIGKKVILPIVGREIPVFADDYVELEFGTGAVKVTPAHDQNDYDMGKRHNLEIINIFNEDASTNNNVPKEFRNLDRYIAREKVIQRLKEDGLLLKVEDYVHKVGYSERGGVPIEPFISEQWFMKMEELTVPALKVVREGKINFHPDHWTKTYEHWMTNITDWCISRQLWWGHRIPVWYCLDCNGAPVAQKEAPIECPHCHSKNLKQDDDVLDTWASSWLWAYDVFRTNKEQDYYYPTDLLVTAPDIIFFWVARMIMAGLHFKKDIPFHDVYFTSIIRDMQGRKMSKSLGNSPDPLDVIAEYGADALRFTVIYLAPLGQDVLFSAEKCELGRNFANKIWNAGRFLLMNADKIELNDSLAEKHMDFADRWILSRLNSVVKEFKNSLDHFEINNASKLLYSFIWNDFCDWYIELAKTRLYSDNEEVKSAVLTRSLNIFESILKLIHPFMPFISEELWHTIKTGKEEESISTSSFPDFNEAQIDADAEKEMLFVQDIITSVRNIRGEMNVPPSKAINIIVKSEMVKDYQVEYIKKLARINDLKVDKDAAKPKAAVSSIVKGIEIYIPLEGLIDLEVERKKLMKEIERMEGSLAGINKKLSNEKFINNAAPEIVEKERHKKTDWENTLNKLKSSLDNLK